mgnify:CR=1 FL=1
MLVGRSRRCLARQWFLAGLNMNLSFKKNLIGLPVETRLGVAVGKISDIELDDVSLVSSYIVQTSKLLPGFLSRQLVIAPKQVVSLTDEKMVVDDNLVKEKSGEWAKMPSAIPSASANMRIDGR